MNEKEDTTPEFLKTSKKYSQKVCNTKTLKKRLPILQWLPTYTLAKFIQDTIAGVTVGLIAIPQGMAYANVAGLPPEYGLYAGMTGGFVYMVFGGCKDVSIGPTAIMSALIARSISGYGLDFAILAAFLAGVIELFMGVFQLGFIVQYISKPVIKGFTNAACLQIITSQLQSLLGHAGPSGHYFTESVTSFIRYVNTTNIWDAVQGISMIVTLIVMQKIGQNSSKDSIFGKVIWYISLSRNAVVVILGIIFAFCLKITNVGEPLTVIGDLARGLPTVKPPPFSTVVGNETYSFKDMVNILGPQSLALPFVSVLEVVAIGRVFSDGAIIDSSQEMIAVGVCNIVGSFVGSMPITASFARAALNRASGSQTPAGGIFTGLLIMLGLSVLTSTFYFIPKSSLAAMIIVAMRSMIDLTIFGKLWRNCKSEFVVMMVTMFVCLYMGLEYGMIAGVIVHTLMLLYNNSKPPIHITTTQCEKAKVITVQLTDNLAYCADDHVRRIILKAPKFAQYNPIIVLEGNNVKRMDYTIATNIMMIIKDLIGKGYQVVFANFSKDVKELIHNICPDCEVKFVTTVNTHELVSYINSISTTSLPILSISK